jgi:CheY-like chemotaxis protein
VSGDRTTPRVLLADDHADMLKLASAALEETCDVVATVTDGTQAVDSAVRLNPDVVVLDITMPGLDGFQVARELNKRGSQAKVVFLSLHEGDEFVVTAFRSGGQAFVSKHRLPTDLPSAVTHVHAGRVFLPSLSSLSAVAPHGGHAVLFYARHDAWCDEAAHLVRTALTRGDGVVLFAPDGTRKGVANRLTDSGFDTKQASADGRYVVADAAETLHEISSDGRPDGQRIAAVIHHIEATRLTLPRPGSRMTVVGEIAASVSPERRETDTMSIERFWNELAGDRAFLTVCGYSMDNFRDDGGDGEPCPGLCAEHWAVSQVLDT